MREMLEYIAWGGMSIAERL